MVYKLYPNQVFFFLSKANKGWEVEEGQRGEKKISSDNPYLTYQGVKR